MDKISYIYCTNKGYWNDTGLFVEGTDAATPYVDESKLKADALDLVYSDFTDGKIILVTFLTEATRHRSMTVEPYTVFPKPEEGKQDAKNRRDSKQCRDA